MATSCYEIIAPRVTGPEQPPAIPPSGSVLRWTVPQAKTSPSSANPSSTCVSVPASSLQPFTLASLCCSWLPWASTLCSQHTERTGFTHLHQPLFCLFYWRQPSTRHRRWLFNPHWPHLTQLRGWRGEGLRAVSFPGSRVPVQDSDMGSGARGSQLAPAFSSCGSRARYLLPEPKFHL